jgi:tripartite-type tricarboxylate transporter receptor subunit TctC
MAQRLRIAGNECMARWRSVAASLVIIGLSAASAAAQGFPAKPIKMVVPYTPGSPVDVLARLATQHAGTRLGQTIVIDNRPGAGTTLGTKAAASADPDGYTILIAATSFIISSVLYPNPGYDLAKSFVPVSMLARSPQVLVIAPEMPAKTVAEFVAHAKANPNKLNFGFGLGTLPQILGETFKAVTTDERCRDMPEVPTMIESSLPQLTLTFSAGVLAPAGTPEPILDALNAAFRDALKSPDLIVSMAKLGFEPEPWTREQYAAFLADEMKKWPPIVKASGVKAE